MLRRFIPAALETTRFPAIAIDYSGRIISINRALAGETGVLVTACAQRHFWDVFYDGRVLDEEGEFLSPLVETLATGKEFTNRYHRYAIGSNRAESKVGRFITTVISSNHDGTIGAVWSFYFPADLVEDTYIEKVFAVRSIIELIASRDSYTRGHVERVTAYALTIGNMMSLEMTDLIRLFICAMTHDVGKVFVPGRILQKPGRLTAGETKIMRRHPEYGADILASFSMSPDIVAVVRHHHERFDGTGYPDGLKGENIPLLSRIMAVGDAFEAMTADRVYRPALPIKEALAELAKNAGSQFDPRAVQALLDFADATDIAGCKDYAACLSQAPCPRCLDHRGQAFRRRLDPSPSG